VISHRVTLIGECLKLPLSRLQAGCQPAVRLTARYSAVNRPQASANFWLLPPGYEDELRGVRANDAAAARRRSVRRWWTMPKTVDERYVLGVLAAGPTRLTSSQIPERLHQRDKDTSARHSALRADLVDAAVLNRAHRLLAIERARRVARVRARAGEAAHDVDDNEQRYASERNAPQQLEPLEAMRGVADRVALSRVVPHIIGVYKAIKLVSKNDAGGNSGSFCKIAAGDAARFVGIDLLGDDADDDDNGGGVAIGRFVCACTYKSAANSHLILSCVVIDEIAETETRDDEQRGADCAGLFPFVATGIWRAIPLHTIRRIDELTYTRQLPAGAAVHERVSPVQCEQFTHFARDDRFLWNSLWAS
jgi:hypothetical protein